MGEAAIGRPSGTRMAAAVLLVLCASGLVATGVSLSGRLPLGLWAQALWHPDAADLRQLLVHYSLAPRAAVALIAGAGLGLAGATFQQVLRNPLASPTTLGVSAGAHLALSVAALAAPLGLDGGREVVALLGAGLSTAVVLLLARRSRFSPLTVILGGMVVTMLCGAAVTALSLFNEPVLRGLFVWGSGALNQQDWSVASSLAPRLAILAAVLALTVRSLQVLDLDESAASLGLPVARVRLTGLGLAVTLVAVIVSAVGVIGFVGLAAPALARALGVRRFAQRLFWSAVLGGVVLWTTDAVLQAVEVWTRVNVPTGAATALLGAPTLLWLVPRLRSGVTSDGGEGAVHRIARPGRLIAILACAAPLTGLASLGIGPAPVGVALTLGTAFTELLPWRWPRALAAAAAGAALAAAGVLLQRLTRNAIASPEVLGVSSGAALGLVLSLLLASPATYPIQLAAAALGGLAAVGALLALTARVAAAPEQILIAGIALGAFCSALLAILMATGDPRMLLIANWMAGSTYGVTPVLAVSVAASAAVVIAACAVVRRWLDIAPLGPVAMQSLGISPATATTTILILASLLTAVATLAVGPLSFVGLIAPHLAQRLGFVRAHHQFVASVLAGTLLMLAADWLGRIVYVPFQVPAGLIGMLIAGPVLLWLLRPGRAPLGHR